MVDLNNQETVKQIAENAWRNLQTLLGYLLIPVVLPVVFLQECLAWFREFVGLNNRSLEGKVVLITGASSGIGETLAHQFFNAGCRLILASRRKDELERVKNDLVRKQSSGTRIYVPAILEMDLGDFKSIPAKAKSALAIYEGIDILVNNAGILNVGGVLETDIDVDKKVMDVNYFGTLALTKAVGNSMKEKRAGHIVFMSSVQGKIAIPHHSAYGASKHAIQALADSLRAELTDDGISVTVISPGYVKTNISVNALTASGSKLGKMTNVIATGLTPEYVSERTLKAVLNREKDVVISPIIPKIAIFLRNFAPSIYFLIMKIKARGYKRSS